MVSHITKSVGRSIDRVPHFHHQRRMGEGFVERMRFSGHQRVREPPITLDLISVIKYTHVNVRVGYSLVSLKY